MSTGAPTLCEADGRVHGCVRRRPKKDELRNPKAKQTAHGYQAVGKRSRQASIDQRIDLPEPAKHRRGQVQGERPIPGRQDRENVVRLERLEERPAAQQHRIDGVESEQARGLAGLPDRIRGVTNG